MLTPQLPGGFWERLAQAPGSAVGEPGLGVCSQRGVAEPAASVPSVPKPHRHLGIREAAEGGGCQLTLKPVPTPLLPCYTFPTTFLLIVWAPLAREPRAELAGGLTSSGVASSCQPP